jgi:hypothetical protein
MVFRELNPQLVQLVASVRRYIDLAGHRERFFIRRR